MSLVFLSHNSVFDKFAVLYCTALTKTIFSLDAKLEKYVGKTEPYRALDSYYFKSHLKCLFVCDLFCFRI